MNFVPLNLLSGYSFLKSAIKLDEYFSKAKKIGYNALALCDYNLIGMPLFFKLAKEKGIKAIAGLTLNIEGSDIVFIVKDEKGYQNLLHLHHLKELNKISLRDIPINCEGLIVIVPSNAQFIKSNFENYKFSKILAKIARGSDDIYLGLEMNEKSYMDSLREFAFSHGYKLVAFPSIRYLNKEDAISLKMLEAIESKEVLSFKALSGEEYLKNIDELKEIYTDEELTTSEEIANKTNFDFVIKRGKMLRYQNSLNLNSDQYLEKLVFDSLKEKGLEKEEYISRTKEELKVISEMGYSDYFLIVKDFIDYARNNDIIVGPGRGSAVGSLVSYLLNITSADPLKYGLIFERFLNKERQTLPDIDVDFEDDKRDQVANYIKNKYGNNRVAKVIAIQKFGAKQALADTGRIFNYEKRDIELFSKAIDKDEEKLSLRSIYKSNKKFRDLVNDDKYYLEIVSLANHLEGLPRQSTLHAAGIVLNDESLEKVMPISLDNDGTYIEQFEKDYLEEQAFLKMDLLSLRNLTIIKDVLLRIKENNNVDLKFNEIPLEDNDAISLIKKGETMGIFQLESVGIRKAIKTLKPKSFTDIAVLLALYRPGPMQNIEEYALRKEGKKKIIYPSPLLANILSETYGIIIYQEQIMQIANKLASFSFAEADLLRRAISKKKNKDLIAYENKFIEGAKRNGVDNLEAKKIYEMILKFADYGFNKSHAIGYAMLTSRMAYLKAHYPLDFYASILSNSNSENFSSTILEIKNKKIKLLNPEINSSSFSFLSKDNTILFPFTAIKGVSFSTALSLINEREERKFTDFFDFVLRMQKYKISSKQILALIDGGCFDKIYPSRATLRNNIANALNYASMLGDENGEMIIDPNMFPKPTMLKIEDDKLENLNKEFDVLGLMLSSSPLQLAIEKIKNKKLINIAQIKDSRQNITLVSFVRNIKTITTKKGKPMAFLSVYDDSGELEITIFPDTYEKSCDILKKNSILLIDGYYSSIKDDFIVNDITRLENKDE